MVTNFDMVWRSDEPRLPRFAEPALFVTALAIQVLVPYYVAWAGLFDLCLLVLVYVSLHRRSEITGMFAGAVVGLAQDALSHDPLGLFGMIKTLVGFLCGWVSQFIEIDFPGARSTLAGFFFFAQHLLHWLFQTVLLSKAVEFSLPRALVLAVLHAVLGWFVFAGLDQLRVRR